MIVSSMVFSGVVLKIDADLRLCEPPNYSVARFTVWRIAAAAATTIKCTNIAILLLVSV